MKIRLKDVTLKNIWFFNQGWYRYRLYYSSRPAVYMLMRIHIREQIEARINSMDRQCYCDGQCKECGCTTTALQMADKPCDGNCYPTMLGKEIWEYLQKGSIIFRDDKTGLYWKYNKQNKKFEQWKSGQPKRSPSEAFVKEKI